MAKKSTPKYGGKLRVPLPRLQRIDEEEVEAWNRAVAERFLELFKHYGIEPPEPLLDPSAERAWVALTFHLARDHVPGFREAAEDTTKPGRPEVWTPAFCCEFLSRVLELRSKGMNNTEICARLALQEPYVNAISKGVDAAQRAETLRTRLAKLEADDVFMSYFWLLNTRVDRVEKPSV